MVRVKVYPLASTMAATELHLVRSKAEMTADDSEHYLMVVQKVHSMACWTLPM